MEMSMNKDASFLVPWHNNIPCSEPRNSSQQTGYEYHPPWSMPFGGVLKEEEEDDRAAGTTAVSKSSHSQAEKRRRDRINAHLATLRKLIPKSDKMDKAALLGSVVQHVRDLKRKASEVSKFITVPTEVDEITVECYSSSDQDGLIRSVDPGQRKDKIFVRASICCDERPGLFAELKQALRGLKLSTVRADIACLEGRIKSILVLCANESEEGVWINNIAVSLKGVLSRIVCSSTAGSSYYSIKSKRQRFFMPPK